MRAAVAAFAVLLAGCTGGTPAARPTTPPPTTRGETPSPTPSPYVLTGSGCQVVRASDRTSGQTFAFVDAHVGVVSQGGWLYRTTDGGATWLLVQDFPAVHDVVQAGCSTLYAVTDFVRRSDDGGATWRTMSVEPPTDLVFLSPSRGYATFGGSSLYATTDGASRWRQRATREVGWIAAAGTRVLLVAESSRVLRSTDLGTHFTEVIPDLDSAALAFAPDGRRAWAAGIARPGGAYVLWHSTDGGLRWRLVSSRRDVLLRSMAASGSTLLATDDDGAAYVSTDAGAHLRRVALPTGIRRLQWVDARHAYASIPDVPTRLFATADAGLTWREVVLP